MCGMAITSSAYASTFDDEFSAFVSSPTGGTAGWSTELPFWNSEHTLSQNHEAEYYVDSSQSNSPFSVSNGILTIQASVAATDGGNPLGLAYNSGVITSYQSFSQLYGYFEVRAQLPAGAGLWPSFWLMPTSFKAGTELDAFEVLGSKPNILYATVHSANAQAALEQALTVADTSTAFHTYGVDWEPQTTTFYMDGQAIATVATPADMNVPMYMLLNLAVGGAGSWPGAPTAQTQLPADMEIDYVHVYQTASTIGWTDPTPSQPGTLILPGIQAAAATGSAFAYVFVEHYGNQDAGTPLGGIGVALRNAAGLIVATGITNSSGFYTFSGLAAGSYSVQYIMPGAYSVRPGGFADASTGVTSSFTLSAGQGYGVPYQLVTSTAELAGTVQLNGASAANVTVKLLDQTGAAISTTQTDTTGRFNFWVAAGQYTIEYDSPPGTNRAAGSLADPTTGLSVPIVLADAQKFLLVPEQLVSTSLNTNPPLMTLTLSNDTGNSTSDKITSSAVLAGSSNPNILVTIRNGVTLLGTTTADSQGHWSFTPTSLVDGSYTLTASETDAAGNTGSAALTFMLDTTPPMVTIGLASDTGSSNSDKVTSSAALTGSGDPLTTITIRKGTMVLGTTISDSSGSWSYSPSNLPNGSNTLTATEIDTAGNSGTATIAITLDTIAPKPAMTIITGISGGGVTLTGTSEANSIVTISDTSNGTTKILGAVTTGTNGAWSLTSHVVVDVSKIHTYTTISTDVAGNVGATPGSLYLASTGNDTLTGNANVSDVFAIMSFKGTDIINGFEASSVVGASHDYINFSGRGITSFSQVQSMMSGSTSTVINIGLGKTVMVSNVAPSIFTAADFRYS